MESPSTTTSSPSGWKIKIRSHSNNGNINVPSLPSTPVIETDNAFDQRLDLWAQTATFQNIASHICHDVQKDMVRRQQQQQDQQQQSDSSHISSSVTSPITNTNTNGNTTTSQPERRRGTMGDMTPFVFDNPSVLTDKEYTTWAQNGREVHHPHQWLKLASLFHIHPKTAHQRSLLSPATLQAAKIDRQVSSEVNRKQLEGYLELRRAQNRNYAENAVAEGVKLYNAKNIQEAQEFYKRALDMDPQYAEGWYRVAESLVQQKRTTEAIAQLNKALRIEPTHENAKALLCTLENTSSYTNKTNPLKDDLLLPTTNTAITHEEDNTNGKESDHRRRKSRGDDSNDESDRHRRKRRRDDSPDSRRRSRRSPSPSHRRSRRSSISPHKSKRSHGYESSSKRSSRHHDRRRHHRSPADSPASSQHRGTKERERSPSPVSNHNKGDDDEDRHHHNSRRRRTRDRSPRRSHQKRKDRSSKRSSHHGSSSKRSSRH